MNMILLSFSDFRFINELNAEDISYKHFTASLNDFTLTLDIWTQTVNLTQTTYNELLKVLWLFKNVNCLKTFLNTLDTLKYICYSQLSLLSLKVKHIEMKQEQQLSLSVFTKNRLKNNTVKMIFFDFIAMIQTMLLSSQFSAKQHWNLAHNVNKSIKFYYSSCWISSICATSKEFAQYSDKKLIFLSDFVYFQHHRKDFTHLK